MTACMLLPPQTTTCLPEKSVCLLQDVQHLAVELGPKSSIAHFHAPSH